ncbi:hypothetical protein Q7C_1078 [Methylophaga frappieri]|uniref:Uncharacterized protein n=2 Tax=Methylophaga frappieri (strain ATCC BAA-2434 / DSM 25690 / JAM7) TaxID=754477 RepID=I1YH42_METFJ|nr:hypothetical protein Q7C_1078 [Methylophaga frappieri]
METESQAICDCADASLRAEAIKKDYEIYTSLAPLYLEQRASGASRVDAFDTASAQIADEQSMTAGELRQITNRIGMQHRALIKVCSS